MQKGVLIKSGKNVIDKRVFAGDLSGVEEALIKEGVEYEIFDDQDPQFVDAVIAGEQPKTDTAWSLLQSNEDKIDFIAKRLGLL